MYIFKQKKPLSIYCLISVAEVVQMKSSKSEAKTASSGFQGGLILLMSWFWVFFPLGFCRVKEVHTGELVDTQNPPFFSSKIGFTDISYLAMLPWN